jgi:hypothetical protein
MKQQTEHKTTVRQENETTVRTQDHSKTLFRSLVFCLLVHSPVLRWSCVLTVVSFSCLTMILCSDSCLILLSYGGLVFCPLFHPPILRWSCVLTVVSFLYFAVVLCSDRCFILLSCGGLVFCLLFHSPLLRWSCVLTVVSFSLENETIDRTQDHCKTGEWNNSQNTRP